MCEDCGAQLERDEDGYYTCPNCDSWENEEDYR